MDAASKDRIIRKSAGARQVFYALMETGCPYLPGFKERKLLTEIQSRNGRDVYNLLSRAGFRRSHNFAYRPACSGCQACVPVRVRAREFAPSRSFQRILRLNRTLEITECPARATAEQYRLFARYLDRRHQDGEMAGMTNGDYRAMVEETVLDTRIMEYRTPEGELVAACLADWLDDGPSAVYSFFEPNLGRLGLGNLMVLKLIESACARGLPHVYLGYWIGKSPKMAYKARFRPIEGLGPDGWQVLQA
ncbi:MAG: arginyltransferase [Pseudomonadota bacterium]